MEEPTRKITNHSESMNPIVEVDNLFVTYGAKMILSGVSLSVVASEIIAILGESGCGKTTLLKTMIGLLKPSRGMVRLFGKEIGDIDDPDTVDNLKRVGVLYQNGALLGSMTIGENIALPLQMHAHLAGKIVDEIVQLKLTQVGLPGAAALYPQELSGGMRKRASLARALVLDPPLLFCDEPSAGLDPVTAAGLDELLLKLRQDLGITIVLITHELASIRAIADNTVFLHRGSVYFKGMLSQALSATSGPLFDFFNRRGPSGETFPQQGARFVVERTA
jgi:phospholipid/cholesterol/gamma-HCH transport system ATP-binding protein